MCPLAIACGDHAGIGPEVALKAVVAESKARPDRRYVLIGDGGHLRSWSERLGLASTLRLTPHPAGPDGVGWLDPRETPLPSVLEPGHATSALAALDYLRRGAEGCLAGEFSALVTAPLSKEAVLRAGLEFTGQTEFLAQFAGVADVTMMLLGEDDRGRWLRVALVTTHLPLREVPGAVTPVAVGRAIRHTADACAALGLATARIAVCGLNPHAGEGGMLGDEEGRAIHPAILAARAAGLDVQGPLPADTVFHLALHGRFDAVVAMYHDQGLPSLKLAAFDRGVNWTLGLPWVRTSPDHGTAFDIAGGGNADPSSMRAAIRLAATLAGA